jgi:UDPglucose 6-dehydrogenase
MTIENKLNITVLGLWHLGCVTAVCCSKYHNVIGLDFNTTTVDNLNSGQSPIFEPNLNESISVGLSNKTLSFTTDVSLACVNANILWVTYDTPVNENDESNVTFVLDNIDRVLKCLPTSCMVLISSQLPVGTCHNLELKYSNHTFVCVPENLRLGKAIDSFMKQDRVIIGIRENVNRDGLNYLLKPFTDEIIFMKVESAEMVKHALNSFLALSIAYINEIACLCEMTNADANEVSFGLKSEPRIGKKSYLSPGSAFAGGTLARDVITLTNLTSEKVTPLISSIKVSNDKHKQWVTNKLNDIFNTIDGINIAILGLTYIENTDTLRRSGAVELYDSLVKRKANVVVYDPFIKTLSEEYERIRLVRNIEEAVSNVDVLVIYTGNSIFKSIDWNNILPNKKVVIIDANRFLHNELKSLPNVKYLSVGSYK